MIRTQELEHPEEGFFSVIAITAFKGGRYERTIQVNFLQRSTAYAYCDKLQDEIDADGACARSYVIDRLGIPIRAGRVAIYRANHFFAGSKRPMAGRR